MLLLFLQAVRLSAPMERLSAPMERLAAAHSPFFLPRGASGDAAGGASG
jgi:hypothetical protein